MPKIISRSIRKCIEHSLSILAQFMSVFAHKTLFQYQLYQTGSLSKLVKNSVYPGLLPIIS